MTRAGSYHAPALSGPQVDDFRRLNQEMKFRCTEEELQGMATEGKLSGRTVGIKDNTAVAGVPMRNGGKLLENYVPEFDATVVSRILDAGASAIEPTVDHLGPMTRTVTDCALLLEVIAGYDDGRDPRQFPNMAVPEYSRLIDGNVSGKKVGLLKEGFDNCTEDIVKTIFYSMYGEYMTQLYGHGNKFYAKANNLVVELTRQYDAALQKFDVIVMPTLPYVATKIPPADIGFGDYHHHTLSMTSNTMPFNSTGHPAITVNAGFAPTDDGKQLPVGLMIVGKKFDDVTVLQVARAVEKLAPKDKLSDAYWITDASRTLLLMISRNYDTMPIMAQFLFELLQRKIS
nr:hypothetical protein BaRGS_029105 [Batillaria attramentaria]